MGRAHEVRAASMAKTAAKKSKLYAIYAKEISKVAKGNPDPVNNLELRRVIEKAKREQVPADVINRNIERVKKGNVEDYFDCEYEAYGPGGSNLIIKCLTDNVNRTISKLKTAFNKFNIKLANKNSVSFMYNNYAIIGIKNLTEEEIMDTLFEDGIDIIDIETEDEITLIYVKPSDFNNVKTSLEKIKKDIEYEIDEISYIPKEKIELDNDTSESFKKLLDMLDEIDDVVEVYHNVKF